MRRTTKRSEPVDRDWTPVRADGQYCSPACGAGCTYAAYAAAVRNAAKLAKRLGLGWEPVVHENMGWFYRVRRGALTVHVSPARGGQPTTYWTLFGYLDGGRNELTIPGTPHYDDPRRAVAAQLAYARKYVAEIQGLIADAEGPRRRRR